jgi:hypothetical protein
MPYFDLFPRVTYTFMEANTAVTRTVADIFTRVDFQRIIASLNVPYDFYEVADGERPDTVAYKYYGMSDLTWLIMLTNELYSLDEWPKSESEFVEYLNAKYGSVAAAQAQIYQYKNAQGLYIDETTYNNLSALERSIVTAYEHEAAVNEARRRIKLIPREYVPQVQRELNTALTESSATFFR